MGHYNVNLTNMQSISVFNNVEYSPCASSTDIAMGNPQKSNYQKSKYMLQNYISYATIL